MYKCITDAVSNLGDIKTNDGDITVSNPSSTAMSYLSRAFYSFKDIDLSKFSIKGRETLE